MRIGIDLDGVVCDFTNSARLLMLTLFGKPASDKVQTSWNFESLGLTPQEEKTLWQQIDRCPNWWRDSIKRLPHTNLLEQVDQNHELFFITNRKPAAGWSIERQTKYWLLRYTSVYCPTVLVTKDKGEVAKALNLDYFIDDKPANCEDVYSNSHKTIVYIQDAPYNQGEVPHLQRASSLNDFFNKIGAA